MFQAVTQVHDQAVSFAPKLIVALVALSWMLPWLMSQLAQYAGELFAGAGG
jgi:flagellar biosynthetic protein FliQ